MGYDFPAIYLASNSPRRRELLHQIAVPFEQLSVDVEESQHPLEDPADLVLRLAGDKAAAGLVCCRDRKLPRRPVLGADTVVVVDATVLGKPAHRDAGVAMLERLSGARHRVYSGVAVSDGSHTELKLSVSTVAFRRLQRAEIEAYWDHGEGRDKAGGYAVQGRAAEFIESIEGSYSGIMGLPLFETAALLRCAARW